MNNSFLSNPNSSMDAMVTDRVVSIDIFNMGVIILISVILLVIVLLIINHYLKNN